MTTHVARGGFAAIAVCLAAASAAAQEPIKIGAIQTYTGPSSTPGTDASNSFTRFFDKVDKPGSGIGQFWQYKP